VDYNSNAVRLARSDCEGSSAVDGTGNMLWNDRDVRSECEEDEGNDCEDADSYTNWFRYTESYMLCALTVRN
jgi:hypothetical protein